MNSYLFRCKYNGIGIIAVDAETESEAFKKVREGDGDLLDIVSDSFDYGTLALDKVEKWEDVE